MFNACTAYLAPTKAAPVVAPAAPATTAPAPAPAAPAPSPPSAPAASAPADEAKEEKEFLPATKSGAVFRRRRPAALPADPPAPAQGAQQQTPR
jgi:hypothetical protein